jgi:hypothetical protein
MITISMPDLPDNYYGRHCNARDLKVGDVVYVGPSAITTPAEVQAIHPEPSGFTVITDKYKLLVSKTALLKVQDK